MASGIPITKNIEENVIDYYLSNPMTIAACAKNFHLCSPTIIKILDKHNIKRHLRAQVNNPFLRENYFHTIDTEKKAYFLGLILTDGNVFVNKNGRQTSISITQNEMDSYLLQEFLNEINANTRVNSDGRGTCQAAVRSNIMAEDLLSYGIKERKTLETYLPTIDDKLMRHMIRGIFDGDGSIRAAKNKNNKFQQAFSFCGTERLMSDLATYVSKCLNINKPTIYSYKNRNLSEVKWQSAKACMRIGEWLYTDATIYMIRKKETFDNYKLYKTQIIQQDNTEVNDEIAKGSSSP